MLPFNNALRCGLAVVFGTLSTDADPLDETQRNLFHLSPIGAWDDDAGSFNNAGEYQARMLSLTGGVKPRNLKLGMSNGVDFLMSSHGAYYDYIYAPARVVELGSHRLGEADYSMELAQRADLPMGFHINGMPWADGQNQSEDHLHNFLERYQNGSLLQVDRLGRFRSSTVAQETSGTEAFPDAAQLEMQVTLSRNATVVRDYASRNCRAAMRILGAARDEHPDLVSFASLSSEVGQNLHANVEYSDYSVWSKQEYRDWLSGAASYTGKGQYASLSAFNTAFFGASGFPWASWAAVQPPTTVSWSGTGAATRWWKKWHDFRIHQVQQMVQAQAGWCVDAGWNPDVIYSHQVPGNPTSTSDLDRMHATPWTTAFVEGAGNGITTYGSNASQITTFSAVRSNDKNWGIFEYNPLDAASVPNNLAALNSVWNQGGKAIAPYLWWGVAPYQIKDGPMQTAMSQFVYDHRNDTFTGLAPHEVSPASRDVIWSMSDSADVESSSAVSGLSYSVGIASGTVSGPGALLSLRLDESPTRALLADSYHAVSFRLYRGAAAASAAEVVWTDDGGGRNSISFTAREGWHVYRIHLSGNPAWREKKIHRLDIKPAATVGVSFKLDWFRLEANVGWNFDSVDEIYGVNAISGISVSGGTCTGTAGVDPYLYLSTDQRDISRDADRAFIDTTIFKKVRVKLSSTAAGTGQLFWWKRGQTSGQFSQVTFPVLAGSRTYEVDLSANANWSGEVTRLRLDPIDIAGVNFTLDRVTVVPVMLAPRITNSDPIVNSPTPVFLWDGVIEPERSGITFTVEMASHFEFTTPIYSRSGLTADRWVYNGATPLDGAYWWRVRARDASGATSPWAVPMPMFVRPWTFDRSLDVVSRNQMQTPAVGGGVWSSITSGFDPYLHFNTGSPINRGINADLYKRFIVRARINAGDEENLGQIFIFPKTGSFSSYAFELPADNLWHDIEVNLSEMPQWQGYIDSVRLDPVMDVGVEVALDHAYFLPAVSSGVVGNGVPQFTKGADQTVAEDSPTLTVNGWIAASSPGVGENWQSLTYLVTHDNAALFAVAPSINSAGTLSYQLAANVHGSATLTVRIQDNGGTANGGIDTSPPQTFTITVLPVNDSPIASGDSLYVHSQVANPIPAATLLANDMDAEGDLLTISSVTTPSLAGAAVSLAGAVINYQPQVNHTGADSFQYTVADGQGGVNSAQVAVTVVLPQITAWSAVGGMFHLEFKGIPNRAYLLQSSDDMRNWNELLTPLTNSSGTLLWDQPMAPGEVRRFYRIKW